MVATAAATTYAERAEKVFVAMKTLVLDNATNTRPVEKRARRLFVLIDRLASLAHNAAPGSDADIRALGVAIEAYSILTLINR